MLSLSLSKIESHDMSQSDIKNTQLDYMQQQKKNISKKWKLN